MLISSKNDCIVVVEKTCHCMFNQGIHRPVCSATETSQSLEI